MLHPAEVNRRYARGWAFDQFGPDSIYYGPPSKSIIKTTGYGDLFIYYSQIMKANKKI
jgi:hypothetical protein